MVGRWRRRPADELEHASVSQVAVPRSGRLDAAFVVQRPEQLDQLERRGLAGTLTLGARGDAGASAGPTPPYKRIRALRLFGSQQTPNTLLQHAEMPITMHISRQRLSQHVKPVQTAATVAALANPPEQTPKRQRKCYSVFRAPENGTSECLLKCYDDEAVQDYVFKMQRITRMEPGQSRYETEFLELAEVGSSEFGSVCKCLHRLDRCVYAIKKSRKPTRGTQGEKTALNEVYAHAVLGQHPHVVRYYSAWAEDHHMIIQNEFCNEGSLPDACSMPGPPAR
ncbi:wee1-like protein kinase [Dermacentor andersoni]|uniref:wee1-like protein kinase n=1 Tax=Dermacentor andersoni TaxID=34620 RepID=UPI002415E3C3|nr:wee1-like protein kinase [Dermacentor andersoni]